MPEFVLDHGSEEAAAKLKRLDPFTQGYVEAMFFTSTGSEDDESLQHATVAELSEKAWNEIRWNCRDFQNLNDVLLACAYNHPKYNSNAAGRDFWLTRNGHGAGFWNRGLDLTGQLLTERCGPKSPFPETDLYRGDDGLLYLS